MSTLSGVLVFQCAGAERDSRENFAAGQSGEDEGRTRARAAEKGDAPAGPGAGPGPKIWGGGQPRTESRKQKYFVPSEQTDNFDVWSRDQVGAQDGSTRMIFLLSRRTKWCVLCAHIQCHSMALVGRTPTGRSKLDMRLLLCNMVTSTQLLISFDSPATQKARLTNCRSRCRN